MPSFRLHATKGVITDVRLNDQYHTSSGGITALQCKIKSSSVTFGGMSGGGVFRDRKFIGIINASSAPGSNASTDFTPVDLIRETYVRLYPEQARKAGIKETRRSEYACRMSVQRFVRPQAPRGIECAWQRPARRYPCRGRLVSAEAI